MLFPLQTIIYVFIISLMMFCQGASKEKLAKNKQIEKIVQKIFNVTSQSFQNANPEEVDDMMKVIETKLNKSAESIGAKGDKYVKIIMHGLKLMATNQAQKPNLRTGANVQHPFTRRSNDSESFEKSNQTSIQNLADKIMKFAKKYFKKVNATGSDQLAIMKSIKHKVLETAKEKHDLIHVKHTEIKKYTDLISRGMELMLKNMTEAMSKRRMVMEFVRSKDDQKDLDEYDGFDQGNDNYGSNMNDRVKGSIVHNIPKVTENPIEVEGLTTPYSCDDMFFKTCADIKILNEFICQDNGLAIPLGGLCNGETDCTDGSDEGDCINKAMERVQSATALMTRIETFLLRNCFLADDNVLLIKQHSVLYDVLQRQRGFLDKYKNMNRDALALTNALTFKRTMSEVILVINTLASALDSSICIKRMNEKKAEDEARKFYPIEGFEVDTLPRKPSIVLKDCQCRNSFCTNQTCPEECKRVCWQKHNLGKWVCQAVDDATSVALDVVCDGKLDCYDETDENDCTTGSTAHKFEANDVFATVLKLLTSKTNQNEYSAVKVKLIALGNSILQLQKAVMKPKVELLQIKHLRDTTYASLVSIYEDFLKQAESPDLEDTHMFLLTMNEKLMLALKLTHTGNDKIISPDGCFCRRFQCASKVCSLACKRACAVGPRLTRYWCKDTVNNNISVSISSICDKIPNCPFEDDEFQCSNDVCRKHHLFLLRHTIRDVGELHKGTALGEALRLWKSKVTSTLKISENSFRPTPSIIRDIVADMLHDLVMMYASIDDTKRSGNDHVLNEFTDISERVIEVLRKCNK